MTRPPRRAAWRTHVALAAGLAWLATPGAAQQLSLRLGGMRTHYADSLDGNAVSLGVRAILMAGAAHGAMEGSLSRFSEGSWAAQGGFGALWLGSLAGPLRAGVALDGSVNYLEGGTTSGTATAGPLVALASGPWLASAAASAGVLRRIDGVHDRSVGGSLRLGVEWAAWRVSGSLARTDAGWARFSDASGTLEFRHAVTVVAVSGGVRTGDLGDGGWVQARANWRVVPWVALEVSGGSYPPDPTGFTRGAFAVAGLRLGASRSGLASDYALPRAPRSLVIETSADGQVRAVFTVRGAEGLAIVGEWNDWTPASLTSLGNGRWLAVVALGAGAHRFALVDGGGRWFVPPGILSVPDGFGSTVGLLLVGP